MSHHGHHHPHAQPEPEPLGWLAPAVIIAGLLCIVVLMAGVSVKQSALITQLQGDNARLGEALNTTQILVGTLTEQRDACLSKPVPVCPPPVPPKKAPHVPQTPIFDAEAHRLLDGAR